jgi:hypothetical protein
MDAENMPLELEQWVDFKELLNSANASLNKIIQYGLSRIGQLEVTSVDSLS